jgi:hypothetical protein
VLGVGAICPLMKGKMKSWKVMLGIGGACAACCALPLGASLAALAAGASGSLALYSGSALPAAGMAVALVGAGAGIWWRRRAARKESACACAAAVSTAHTQGGCDTASCRVNYHPRQGDQA